jgi:ABC-2 type transport system permease protein
MSDRRLFLMRLHGILRKETLQIRRDPSSILLALVMPIVLLFIFGYGVSLDAENVPVAIVMEKNATAAHELAARFELSAYFRPVYTTLMQVAQDWLDEGRVDCILHLKGNFSRRVAGPQADVQLIVNGTDANRARQIHGYARSVLQKWMQIRQARGEPVASVPVAVQHRTWYNESGISRNYLVPGLMSLIMTLIGTLLTALVVAREWERGTMEAILVTPLRRIDLLLGKILPYFLLGMLGMVICVAFSIVLFHVPFRGSIAALVLLSSLFMLASLGFGLFVSATIRVQFVAAQISILAGFLPALILSGLLFDLESTPLFIRVISHLVPARYFVAISHTLFMAGDVWPVLWPNAAALAVMALFFIGLAYRQLSKRLEA